MWASWTSGLKPDLQNVHRVLRYPHVGFLHRRDHRLVDVNVPTFTNPNACRFTAFPSRVFREEVLERRPEQS